MLSAKTFYMRKLIFVVFAYLFVCGISFAQQNADPYLLYNVQIVDVENGTVRSGSALLIQQGRIRSIGSEAGFRKQYSNLRQVDGLGRYLLPGLWDMHVHLEGAELVEDNKALLPLFLAYGITTVRDCANDLGLQVLKWRDEIVKGKLPGPSIYTAGRKLEGKNSIWKGDLEIANESELQAMLDTLVRDKVDFVKITENTLTGDLFLKSVAAAHARGFRVSGHVPLDLSIEQLLQAGYTSVEHASYLLRLGYDESRISSDLLHGRISKAEGETFYATAFDQQKAIEGYKKLGAKGLFVCPTLIGTQQLAWLDQSDHSKDEFLQYLSEKFVSNYQWRIQRMAGETTAQKQQRRDRLELLKKQLPLMLQAGIQLIAGSDAAALNTYVYPAESLLQELEIFQQAGLTPLQILRSVTINGAKYFDVLSQTATIAEGKMADLILVDENPLDDIFSLRKLHAVIAKGVFYDRKQLQAIKQEAKRIKKQLDKDRASRK